MFGLFCSITHCHSSGSSDTCPTTRGGPTEAARAALVSTCCTHASPIWGRTRQQRGGGGQSRQTESEGEGGEHSITRRGNSATEFMGWQTHHAIGEALRVCVNIDGKRVAAARRRWWANTRCEGGCHFYPSSLSPSPPPPSPYLLQHQGAHTVVRATHCPCSTEQAVAAAACTAGRGSTDGWVGRAVVGREQKSGKGLESQE